MEWFYQLGEEEIGPLSKLQMSEFYDAGIVEAETWVRAGTGGPWVCADSVFGDARPFAFLDSRAFLVPALGLLALLVLVGVWGARSQATNDREDRAQNTVAEERARASENDRVAALPAITGLVYARSGTQRFYEPDGAARSMSVQEGTLLYVTEDRGAWLNVRPEDASSAEEYWVRASDTMTKPELEEALENRQAEVAAREEQVRAESEARAQEIMDEGAEIGRAMFIEVNRAKEAGIVRERIPGSQTVVVNGRIWSMMSRPAQQTLAMFEAGRFQQEGGTFRASIVEELSGNVLYSYGS